MSSYHARLPAVACHIDLHVILTIIYMYTFSYLLQPFISQTTQQLNKESDTCLNCSVSPWSHQIRQCLCSSTAWGDVTKTTKESICHIICQFSIMTQESSFICMQPGPSQISLSHAHAVCDSIPLALIFFAKERVVVCWLLNVPATCKSISGMDLPRQVYVLLHWDSRSNFPSHPVTAYWHQAHQSQYWPYNARHLAGLLLECQFFGMTWPQKNPSASGIRTRDLPLSRLMP